MFIAFSNLRAFMASAHAGDHDDDDHDNDDQARDAGGS